MLENFFSENPPDKIRKVTGRNALEELISSSELNPDRKALFRMLWDLNLMADDYEKLQQKGGHN